MANETTPSGFVKEAAHRYNLEESALHESVCVELLALVAKKIFKEGDESAFETIPGNFDADLKEEAEKFKHLLGENKLRTVLVAKKVARQIFNEVAAEGYPDYPTW